MANSLVTNPIVLDTTGATSALGNALRIRAIHWDAPTTAGHTCVLHDALSGAVVVQFTAQAGLVPPPLNFPGAGLPVKGLYLTTLASGKLLVYTD